ncbi:MULTISPECIES: hypothetical protein [unclassified Crossiella]|uniref:hypothetical protein n=1 Tax=unclassified Crossiella TaxID=2620835 RepID=UPI001FFFA690|nr:MULTISPECIES: hypothetical protein [unclassified Crossiella]MCK2239963.1 hypothetical protein [Crossiella sp. S99.2]MCK2252671.1 hypothetical protein [Crossiella sp. S99.1]
MDEFVDCGHEHQRAYPEFTAALSHHNILEGTIKGTTNDVVNSAADGNAQEPKKRFARVLAEEFYRLDPESSCRDIDGIGAQYRHACFKAGDEVCRQPSEASQPFAGARVALAEQRGLTARQGLNRVALPLSMTAATSLSIPHKGGSTTEGCTRGTHGSAGGCRGAAGR